MSAEYEPVRFIRILREHGGVEGAQVLLFLAALSFARRLGEDDHCGKWTRAGSH